MKKLLFLSAALLFGTQTICAQLSITSLDTPFNINFDISVSGILNGQFGGSGFVPSPGSGQIDSDGIIVTGISDGDLSFGATGLSGDFTRGTSSGGESSGGIFAFEVFSGNHALGVQSTETDWTPGAIILKVFNATGGTINTFEISYNIYSYNDQDRSISLSFYYSVDNSTYINTSILDHTTIELQDGSPSWDVSQKSVKISAKVVNGSELYLKWIGSDAGGSGSRDEIALDDISISAHYEDIKVIISEVADNSTSDKEYVEIFNGGSEPINIEGWKLVERYNPNNSDERNISLNSVNQKNSGGSDYLKLNNNEYAVVVRSDHVSLKSEYSIGDDIAIFEDSWPPAMTGDERYQLLNALGDVIDGFGLWEYADASSFRLTASKCYERINDAASDGESANNWTVNTNSSYSYTPGSGNSSPLPVELVSFYAKVKTDIVLLLWQTASEINNYGFDIERSIVEPLPYTAGKHVTYLPRWEVIGFIEGHGNSYSVKNYSFIDSPDRGGNYSYRLKQIDIDGRFEYSDIITVKFSSRQKDITLFQNYPNPVSATGGSAFGGNQITIIRYSILSTRSRIEGENSVTEMDIHGETVSLKVYDILGREVETLTAAKQKPGNYEVQFDCTGLSSGVYYYTVKTPASSISKKMIILK